MSVHNVVKILDAIFELIDQRHRAKEARSCSTTTAPSRQFRRVLPASAAYRDISSEDSSDTFLCALGAQMESEVSVRKEKFLELSTNMRKGGIDGGWWLEGLDESKHHVWSAFFDNGESILLKEKQAAGPQERQRIFARRAGPCNVDRHLSRQGNAKEAGATGPKTRNTHRFMWRQSKNAAIAHFRLNLKCKQ